MIFIVVTEQTGEKLSLLQKEEIHFHRYDRKDKGNG